MASRCIKLCVGSPKALPMAGENMAVDDTAGENPKAEKFGACDGAAVDVKGGEEAGNDIIGDKADAEAGTKGEATAVTTRGNSDKDGDVEVPTRCAPRAGIGTARARSRSAMAETASCVSDVGTTRTPSVPATAAAVGSPGPTGSG